MNARLSQTHYTTILYKKDKKTNLNTFQNKLQLTFKLFMYGLKTRKLAF